MATKNTIWNKPSIFGNAEIIMGNPGKYINEYRGKYWGIHD